MPQIDVPADRGGTNRRDVRRRNDLSRS
ncbi:hypothetical protein G9444_3747 [Rhodococcus erythropolis]|uniref:Uncharacterized protein n=1 Tax=Rhodococcus erythropolis TaxID=1833 RepID=A0A6G9CWK7_RHOER|nr:hypothetical protein G9444_3747 [Rhodococcus erythropolis]